MPALGEIKAKRRNNKNHSLFSPVASLGTSFFTCSCAGSFVPALGEALLGICVVCSGTGVVAVKIDR